MTLECEPDLVAKLQNYNIPECKGPRKDFPMSLYSERSSDKTGKQCFSLSQPHLDITMITFASSR